MTIQNLPNEIIIEILIKLDYKDLLNLLLLNRFFNSFIYQYKNLLFNNLVNSNYKIDELNSLCFNRRCLSSLFYQVSDWFDYFKRSHLLLKSWPNKNNNHCLESHLNSDSIWRIKFDNNTKCFLFTSTVGGLHLQSTYYPFTIFSSVPTVSPFSHLEYENSYASTHGSNLDIWFIDSQPHENPQITHLNRIIPPFQTRASRLKFGTLSLASANGRNIALYSISNCELLRVINTVHSSSPINYIEQTETEVLVCRLNKIEIYSKLTGSLLTVLNYQSFKIQNYFQFTFNRQLSSDVEPLSGQLSKFLQLQINQKPTIISSLNDEDEDDGDYTPSQIGDDDNNMQNELNERMSEVIEDRNNLNNNHLNNANSDDENGSEGNGDDDEIDLIDILLHDQNFDSWNAVHVDNNKLVTLSDNKLLIINDYQSFLNDSSHYQNLTLIDLSYFLHNESSQLCFENSTIIFELGLHLCIIPLNDNNLNSSNVPINAYVTTSSNSEPASAIQCTDDAIFTTYLPRNSNWPHGQLIRVLNFTPVID